MAEEKNAQRLKEERQLLPQRLMVFLIGNSVLVLGFSTMIDSALFLSRVLGFVGLVFTCFGLAHFWRLPRRLDTLEGIQDRGFRRFLKTWKKGRGIGIPCSILFIIFWLFALVCSFWEVDRVKLSQWTWRGG